MRLDHLTEGSQDCPLIRLYEYTPGEFEMLHAACAALGQGAIPDFLLDCQPWVHPVDGCRLIFKLTKKNRGARGYKKGEPMALERNTEGWLEVAEKLEALGSGGGGYQWICCDGDVPVLVSRWGQW